VDLGGRVRGASVDAAVVRSHLGRWIGVGGGTLVTAALAMVLANSLSTTVPPAASPLLAAAGAFGIVLVLAVVIARAGTSRR